LSDDELREQRRAILLVTLNRPEARNAISRQVMQGLAGAVEEAENDKSISTMVVTGAGDRAFCAGVTSAPSPTATMAARPIRTCAWSRER